MLQHGVTTAAIKFRTDPAPAAREI